MKYISLVSALGLFVGCAGSWKDTGEQGPWRAPNVRARVFYRDRPSVAGPQHGEVAYEHNDGTKGSEGLLRRELDDYFNQCSFIKKWPKQGTVNGVANRQSPYDFCLVSMEPIIVIGVERADPKVSALDTPATKPYVFLSSKHLLHFIEVRTTLPYHDHANVVWFAPVLDHELHGLVLDAGKGTIVVGESVQIAVAVDGARLVTTRK